MSYKSEYSILSDKKIKDYLDNGEIIIDPYNEKNLNTNSYDVTLGEWHFREQKLVSRKHIKNAFGNLENKVLKTEEEWYSDIYNMYSQENVDRIWGKPQQAMPHQFYMDKGIVLENIKPDEKIIFIGPGETILAHTNEFIGGVNTVTTMMKARSSIGRNFLKVCSCAGLGDVGYTTRWTLEITNSSKTSKIPLIVGRRLAQIIFFETDGILDKNYSHKGKYQQGTDLDELKKNWKPENMLPKMYKDFENFI